MLRGFDLRGLEAAIQRTSGDPATVYGVLMSKAAASARVELDAAQAGSLDAAWQEIQPDAARRLLIAAVDAFAARGYHGTTTRDIADRAGLSPAGVYVHYRSKEELLYRIALIGHQHTHRVVADAKDSAATPTPQPPPPLPPPTHRP